MSPAGLLHHFQSKDQLLHAVLDARDAADLADADLSGDLIVEIRKVAERIESSPELVGTFVVMLVENLMPEAPLHDRLLDRWKVAVGIVAASSGATRRSDGIGPTSTPTSGLSKSSLSSMEWRSHGCSITRSR